MTKFEKAIELHKRYSRISFKEIKETDTELVVRVTQTRSPQNNHETRERLEEITKELYALKEGFQKRLKILVAPYVVPPSDVVTWSWVQDKMQEFNISLKTLVEDFGISKADLSATINGHKEMGVRTQGLFYYYFLTKELGGKLELFNERIQINKTNSTEINTKFDIENRLRIYFPILFELLNSSKIDWRKVEQTFSKKYTQYKNRFDNANSAFPVEASFYNIITSSIKMEPGAILLLDFIQKLFEELTERLNEKEKKLIKPNIFGFLTNIDMKYLNFLGELAVLNHLKRALPIELVNTEEPLIPTKKNGTKIDFHFLNTDTNKKYLIEIVNIHLTESNTINDEAIGRLLHQKIGEKLLKTGIKESNVFQLIPILWGNWREIKAIEIYFENMQPKFENTLMPVAYVPFTDQNGNMVL